MRSPAKTRSPIIRLLMLTSLITSSISCQKEVPLKPARLKPAIKLSAAKDTVYVGEQVLIQVHLEGINHRFQIVERDSKNSSISDKDGKTATDWNADRNQKAGFYFTAMEEGIHELSFRAVDQGNQSTAATLRLIVKPHSFKVEADSEQKEMLVNESVDIKLHIEDKLGARFPKQLLCQSDLKGAFTIEGKPYTGEAPLSIGAKKDIAISFKALQSGQGKLRFTVSDTNKTTQTVSTPLTVTDPTFTVVSTAKQDTIYVNKTAEVRLEITDKQDTQKTLRCYSDVGGSFTVGGQACTKDSPVRIGTKDKIDDIVFKPAKIGTAHLGFILQDAYQRQERRVTVHAKPVPFDIQLVAATSDKGNKLVKQDTIKLQVVPRGDASGISYHWTYKVKGTGAGTLAALPEMGSPNQITPYKITSYTYQVNRESGPEASGQHTISISVQDSYGQTKTQQVDFDVVKFPRIKDADFYYKLEHFFPYRIAFRHLKAQHIKGERGSYDIEKIRVKIDGCRNKEFKYDKELKYDPSGVAFTLFTYGGITKHLKDYRKEYGCETGEARATFWLVDSQKNMSRPLTKILRASK